MMVTWEEVCLAREFVYGEITEEQLRAELTTHAKDVILEALKLDLVATRRELAEAQDDLKSALAKITQIEGDNIVLSRKIAEIEARSAL